MLHAFVFIKTERDQISNVIQALLDIKGVTEVFSVTGKYDIISILRVTSHEEISRVVTEKFVKVKGIADTHTVIAFKAYSKHDLESMFSIGFEE